MLKISPNLFKTITLTHLVTRKDIPLLMLKISPNLFKTTNCNKLNLKFNPVLLYKIGTKTPLLTLFNAKCETHLLKISQTYKYCTGEYRKVWTFTET